LKARSASVSMASVGQRICWATPARVQPGAAGNKAAGEGQARVKMPFCAARRGAGARAHQVAEDLVRGGLRVLTDPGGGCLPGHAGRQAGRHEIVDATGVYFRGLVHAPHYQ
jgi:hypothetical protein